MSAALNAFVAAELAEPAEPETLAMAAELARRIGSGVRTVLAARQAQPSAILDLYVLTDGVHDLARARLAVLLDEVAPPNLGFHQIDVAPGPPRRAAALSLSAHAFRRLVGPSSLDTTVWSRFVHPARLAWARDPAAGGEAAAAVARAVATAGLWAARLGPEIGTAKDYWSALFRQTDAAELRVAAEPAAIGDDPRWSTLLFLAWDSVGLAFEDQDGRLRPLLSPAEREAGFQAWAWRLGLGKPLGVLKLAKTAFTTQGLADYAAWRIEDRTGLRIEVTPEWRRRPILGAPAMAWGLWRRGGRQPGG